MPLINADALKVMPLMSDETIAEAALRGVLPRLNSEQISNLLQNAYLPFDKDALKQTIKNHNDDMIRNFYDNNPHLRPADENNQKVTSLRPIVTEQSSWVGSLARGFIRCFRCRRANS